MNRNLVLITSHFPQKGKEPFLREELPVLASHFEKVFVLPLHNGSDRYTLDSRIHVSDVLWKPISKLKKLWILLRYSVLIKKITAAEKRPNGKSLLLKLIHQSDVLRAFSKLQGLEAKETVYYSYWADEGAAILGLAKLKETDWKTITRTHGYDIYEEDYPQGLPYFYTFSLNSVSRIFCISEDGKKYLEKKYPKYARKLEVSYLGTKDQGTSPEPKSNQPLKLLSCSAIIPLKRLDLIAKALNYMKEEVEWHHYGRGSEQDMVLSCLNNNLIKPYFHGYIVNKELLDIYRTQEFHLFMNVSRTEGLPVSLMEAASFGIPTLATDVRGTREVCNASTGSLVDATIEPGQLAEKIIQTIQSKTDRSEIRQFWKDHFEAKTNYSRFANSIKQL